MRFKETGKKILCIRTSYNKDKGRGEDKTIVSLERWVPEITDEARMLLTPEELEQLQKLLQEKQVKQDTALLRMALTGVLGKELERAVEALKAPEIAAKLTELEAARIWKGLDDMRRELRKAGFGRPGKSE